MTQVYEPRRRVSRAPLAVLAAAAVAGGIIVAIVLANDSGGSEATLFNTVNPLAEAATTCDAGALADQDHTLLVDMAGDNAGTGTDTIDGFLCVLAELEAPQAILARMESTRALDGMQSATWSTYEATWNYHPDDGLDLIITDAG